MSLIESYEQQYSTVTADITHTISKVSTTNGGTYKISVGSYPF